MRNTDKLLVEVCILVLKFTHFYYSVRVALSAEVVDLDSFPLTRILSNKIWIISYFSIAFLFNLIDYVSSKYLITN